MTQSNDKKHERPVQVFDEGRVQAAVWQRRGEADEPSYYVSVSKSYRGSDGQWKKCSTFSTSELKDLDKCLDRARKWIHERQVTVDKQDRQHRSERERERGDRPRERDEQPSQSQSSTKVRMDDLVDAIAKRLEQRINRQR